MTTATRSATRTEKVSYGEACRWALDDAMAGDDRVFLLGEDIADEQGGGTFKVTSTLSTKYGTERVRTTPISEQAIMGAAVGAAIAGMRPVAEIMLMNFLSVCLDQITNHAAKLRFMSGGQTTVPLTIRTATGAGKRFGAQHSDMLEAWLAHTPGLKVVVPSSATNAYGLLLACIEDDNPCVFIENTAQYFTSTSTLPSRGVPIALGKADVVRAGGDVTLVTYGRPVGDCVKVAEQLAAEGIGIEVIDLQTVAPWDERTVIDAVARTGRVVIVHEAVARFGVAAELSHRINEELFGQLSAPVGRVGSAFCPVPFSGPLEDAYLYSVDKIISAVRATNRD